MNNVSIIAETSYQEPVGRVMATIKERTSKAGTVTYQAQVRRKGYPAQSKNFLTKKSARDWATLIESSILKNENINPREQAKWTIEEVIEWYLLHPDPNRKLETKKHFNRLKFLQVEFKDFTVHSLTAQILSKWINRRLKINAPATVYHYYVALKNAMIHHSVLHSYSQNIFNVAKCPTQSGERNRRFSPEETRKLFKSIYKKSKIKKNEMRVTVLFALETACRIGEMLKLKWENVNLKEQYIEFLATDTKTKEFRRVPITSVAKNILIWLQKHHNPEKIKDKRVFEFFHDNEHHLSRQFQICCKRAEINDIRWHDLRHEGTSRLYEKGKNLTDMEISLITGHKTLDMLKRYTHLRPNSILSKLW